MEVDAITESLDHGHHSRHKLKACGCVQEFHKRLHCRETERIEEFPLVTEEQTQHLGDGEDDLPVGDTGCGQIHTSDCRSRDTSRQHPGSQDENTRTPSRTDAHILEGTAQNNKRTPGKTPCVPDDAGGRSLPRQGG